MSPLPASPALNSLLRLLRAAGRAGRCAAPLAARTSGRARPGTWPGSREATYTPVPPSPALPPGAGEPNRASDLALRERLVRDGRLALDELRRSASWLGARLRRAGVGMAWPPSTCRPATKACCWWPAIRRRALRWTGSACSSHRCSPPPVASPALRRSSRPTRNRRCCSTARRRRWNSTRPSLPCLASGRAGLARLPPGQPWATGARQPGASAGPRRGGGGVRRTHPALAVHSRQRRGRVLAR